jgi:hypothetical protein
MNLKKKSSALAMMPLKQQRKPNAAAIKIRSYSKYPRSTLPLTHWHGSYPVRASALPVGHNDISAARARYVSL